MVKSAMNDDRVPYWLPLKWVARLRDQLSGQEQGDKPLIVCHVDYYGRHSETEGMYRRIEKVEFKISCTDIPDLLFINIGCTKIALHQECLSNSCNQRLLTECYFKL